MVTVNKEKLKYFSGTILLVTSPPVHFFQSCAFSSRSHNLFWTVVQRLFLFNQIFRRHRNQETSSERNLILFSHWFPPIRSITFSNPRDAPIFAFLFATLSPECWRSFIKILLALLQTPHTVISICWHSYSLKKCQSDQAVNLRLEWNIQQSRMWPGKKGHFTEAEDCH